MRRLFLPLVILASACGVPEEGPWMRPGQDCLSCHGSGGTAEKSTWTVGGTAFDSNGDPVADAQIVIRDATGRTITLRSNGGGNFYTAEPLREPYQAVSILHNGRQRNMPISSGMPARGACNSCHSSSGLAGSPLFVP